MPAGSEVCLRSLWMVQHYSIALGPHEQPDAVQSLVLQQPEQFLHNNCRLEPALRRSATMLAANYLFLAILALARRRYYWN